jgi:DNA-binding CsgD family transcriptional regulator
MDLLERERSLLDLSTWHAAVAANGGCIALISGEAGIGKTALVEEFSKRPLGVRLLWGACDALFTPRPLAPLHDVAGQTRGPLLQALAGGTRRDLIFTAALEELSKSPSLVIFEDMHWADEATLDLLKYLGRRIQRAPAMLVVTYRDDEVGSHHPLRSVIGDLPRAHTHRLTLNPLSEAAVGQLAHRAGRAPAHLHRVTGGNPLFVTEVLAAADDTVPATVRDAVLARAARLSPAARDIAELICVVPGKAEDWLVQQAGGSGDAAVEECLGLGLLLRHEDGSLGYRHELVRRALESTLSAVVERRLHAQVLELLMARSNVPPARLAHHAHGAGDGAAVLRFASLAATQAVSMGAHREAASHLRAALLHAESLAPPERAALYEQLSYECYLTDQIDRSIEARRAALDIWQASGARKNEGDALRWLSRLSWFAGRRAEAERYSDAAVATLETMPVGPELAMAYSNRSQLHMLAHATESAIHWAGRTIELAGSLANDEILCHALNNLGTSRLIQGDGAGWADLDRSMELARAGGHQEHAARAFTNLSSNAVSRREYGRAARYLREGLAYCELYDLDSWRLYMLAWSAREKLERGDWSGAGDAAEIVLQHARSTPITRVPALTVLGQLRLRRGDPDAATPLEEARRLAEPTQELQRIGPLALAMAEAAWLNEDRPAVLGAIQPAFELARHEHDPWMTGELAAWLWRFDALESPPGNIAEPFALEISGDWRAAVTAWKAIGCPFECARLLARHGTEDELREALGILEKLGAAPAALAVRKQLRALGIRGIPRGSRLSTRSHAHGLTGREAEVLTLLTEGLRNSVIAKRLFVSTKTVDNHVSAILAKFGVPSRAEAVAMARLDPGAETIAATGSQAPR